MEKGGIHPVAANSQNEDVAYWRRRVLRAESVSEAAAGEAVNEPGYWMRRARIAEDRLQEVSRRIDGLEAALKRREPGSPPTYW